MSRLQPELRRLKAVLPTGVLPCRFVPLRTISQPGYWGIWPMRSANRSRPTSIPARPAKPPWPLSGVGDELVAALRQQPALDLYALQAPKGGRGPGRILAKGTFDAPWQSTK